MIPLAILGGALIGAAIMVLLIRYKDVLKWFQKKVPIDRDHVGVTLKKQLDNGNFKVLKVGFNKATNNIEEHELNEAKEIDDELASKSNSFVVDY